MDCCRACLTQKRSLRSLFLSDKNDNTSSYAEMLSRFAKVEIRQGDGLTDKICLSCRRCVEDAYKFKSLVEESDKYLRQNSDNIDGLQQSPKINAKKIHFNNLNDIKIEIECSKLDNILEFKSEVQKEDIKLKFDCSNCTIYKNTVIRKLGVNEQAPQISVEDFLNKIKSEVDETNCDLEDNDFFDDYLVSGDDEYLPPDTKKVKKKKSYGKSSHKHKKKIIEKEKKDLKVKRGAEKSVKKLAIKPVFLEDVRLVPSKPIRVKPRGPRKNRKVKEKLGICPYCGKISKNLHTHLLIHTGVKSFKCIECPKAYYTKAHLEKHALVHTGIKNFKCDKCTASFYNKGLLNSHILSHAEERKHVCDTCSKAFKRKSALGRHVIRHSSANKTINCELCNMSFFEKFQLRHHMRVHTGERPYNCQICSQPYSYKHDFNRHCFKKHGVFLKRRSVHVMNEEVLVQERALMKEVLIRSQINGKDAAAEPVNPFKGPQAAMAFQQTVQALQMRQMSFDY